MSRGLNRRHIGVGAVVAVLAVGLAIPLLREVEPVVEAPEPTQVEPEPDIVPTEDPIVYDVDFADPQHGFALWGRCTSGSVFRCERRLLVTRDGRTWAELPFADPELGSPERLVGRVVSLGGERIALTNLAKGGGDDRFYSDDGGRSWRSVPSTASRTVATVPPDAVLETQCVETVHDVGECRSRRVVVTLPESGERAWLEVPPPLAIPTPERRPAADGSWWVTGKDRRSGQWAVAVSRDGGRSWPVALLPVGFGMRVDGVTVAGSGPTVYALATVARQDTLEPRNLAAIFQSTGGGVTWLQTWRAGANPPRTLGGTAIITPDGGLLIPANDVGPAYRSPDGGYHFAPAADTPRVTHVRRTRAGYLAITPGLSPIQYLTSPDGVTWSSLDFP